MRQTLHKNICRSSVISNSSQFVDVCIIRHDVIVCSTFRFLRATLAQTWLRRARLRRFDAGRDTARDDALRVQRRSQRVRLLRAVGVVTR